MLGGTIPLSDFQKLSRKYDLFLLIEASLLLYGIFTYAGTTTKLCDFMLLFRRSAGLIKKKGVTHLKTRKDTPRYFAPPFPNTLPRFLSREERWHLLCWKLMKAMAVVIILQFRMGSSKNALSIEFYSLLS